MRIGHGYDVHKLVRDRKLILGGVLIKYEYGLLGHSDADVIIHSVCDSLLGAAAKGDIGKHFPDNDDTFKDIDSRILLRKVYEIISESGFKISNIDITVIAQAPKLSGYIEEMKKNLCDDLQLRYDRLNIKATTEENLGFTGRKEGIACHSVCLLDE